MKDFFYLMVLFLSVFFLNLNAQNHFDYKLKSNAKIIHNTKYLKDIKKGDVLIITEGDGNIIRVVGEENGEYKFEPASFEEAFDFLEVSYSGSLKKDDIKNVSYYFEGVKLEEQRSGKNFKIKLDNVILFDYDGNPNTKDDIILADGFIDIISDIEWKINIDGGSIQELKFINLVDQKSDFKINISTPLRIPLPFSKEFKLVEYEFSPVTIGPVVFTPVLAVYAGFNIGVAGKVMINIDQKISGRYGTHYLNGKWEGIAGINDKAFKGFLSFIGADGWLKGYAGPKLKLKFYDTFAPYIEGFGYLRTTADLINYKPIIIDWKIFGGVEANLGVSVKVFSSGMKDFEKKVWGWESLVNSGTIGSKPSKSISVEPILEDGETYRALNNKLITILNHN